MNDPLEKSNLTQAEYFKDIVGTIREPLLVLDGELRVLAANRSFYKTFKVKKKDTLGNQIYVLGNRQWDIPGLRLLLETILPDKAVFNDYTVEHEFPIIGRRILLLNARRIPAPPKEARWILLAFEDITERRELERVLQASEQRFRLAFETATDTMLLVDKTSGQVLNSNRAAQQTFRYSNQKLLKMNLWELDILKDQQQFEQVAGELEIKGAVQILNNTVHTRGGKEFPVDIYLMDRTGVIQCNIRDITESSLTEAALRKSAASLRELSVHDHLTGLFNRRYMEETLKRELLRASRKQHSLGIIMLDVDDFKHFNDTYSHAAGDAVLRKMGDFLLGHVRGEDIACRYGGDEFIIVLPDTTRDVTVARADQICEYAKQFHLQFEGKILQTVTLSLGVAAFPGDGTTSTAILRAVDTALYRAKWEGSDRVVVAS